MSAEERQVSETMATQNPIDAAIARHTWPDGDWHHETCRCGESWPCDANVLARAINTALEELDFHNRALMRERQEAPNAE